MDDLKLLSSWSLFNKSFKTAKYEIFRLELFPEYRVEFEKKHIAYFKKHGEHPPFDEQYLGWCRLLEKKKKEGVNHWRIRRISKPHTLYERYEIAAYKMQAPYGLKVWAFTRPADFLKIEELNVVPYAMDYWMFDEKTILLVQYDMLGKYMRVWQYLGSPKPYIALKNKLKKISKRLV